VVDHLQVSFFIVAEPRHFYAAPAPGEIFDGDPVAPTPVAESLVI
jgi:hypothetical protein